MSMTYDEYVMMGRDAFKVVELYQLKIAKYAIGACEIRHGGYSHGVYTLKRYASDIGISYKKLSRWTLIYRDIILKLSKDIDDITARDWESASKVYSALKKEQAVINASKQRVKAKGFKGQVSPETINELFNKFHDGAHLSRGNIHTWTESIIRHRHNFQCANLSGTSIESIRALKQQLDKFSSIVTEYLINNGDL